MPISEKSIEDMPHEMAAVSGLLELCYPDTLYMVLVTDPPTEQEPRCRIRMWGNAPIEIIPSLLQEALRKVQAQHPPQHAHTDN
jgi:hypothetical protein